MLDDEFVRYCELNKITDMDSLAKKTFQRGFTILKFGETPVSARGKETIVEKEVIREVEKIVEIEKIIEIIKEVPVERIVEIIKEVPVEVKGKTQIITKEVIKEVPIEKIVVNDEENKKLKDELNKITESLEKMNKARYLKGSDLNNLYEE